MIIAIRAVSPALDVVRRHYGMDHLHESGWSMDFRPTLVCVTELFDMVLLQWAMLELFLTSVRVVWIDGKCKGTREYVRKPPSFPLARKKGWGSTMRRYIWCELCRQIYSMGLIL